MNPEPNNDNLQFYILKPRDIIIGLLIMLGSIIAVLVMLSQFLHWVWRMLP